MAVPANDDAESAENLESSEGVVPAEGVASAIEGQETDSAAEVQATTDAE
jgi:hypothetical protein